MSFVKIYETILDSSIWGESLSTRVVWITMLTLADKDGLVAASSDGISRRANVALRSTDAALDVLQKPDPRSKSDEHEGRRVEKIDGGWKILNYAKYRELRTDKQISDAERQRKHRNGEATPRDVSQMSQDVALDGDVEADAKADTDKSTTTTAREGELTLVGIADVLRLPVELRDRWVPMLDGMTKGLGTSGMKAVPIAVLMEAAIELSTAGGDVTAHRYKVFVNKVLARIDGVRQMASRAPSHRGFTLAATQFIQRVRKCRSIQFPTSLDPSWQQSFNAQEREIVKAFGVDRILNDKNEGTLVAQLAKALEESNTNQVSAA